MGSLLVRDKEEEVAPKVKQVSRRAVCLSNDTSQLPTSGLGLRLWRDSSLSVNAVTCLWKVTHVLFIRPLPLASHSYCRSSEMLTTALQVGGTPDRRGTIGTCSAAKVKDGTQVEPRSRPTKTQDAGKLPHVGFGWRDPTYCCPSISDSDGGHMAVVLVHSSSKSYEGGIDQKCRCMQKGRYDANCSCREIRQD
jgi:hypothetical protein